MGSEGKLRPFHGIYGEFCSKMDGNLLSCRSFLVSFGQVLLASEILDSVNLCLEGRLPPFFVPNHNLRTGTAFGGQVRSNFSNNVRMIYSDYHEGYI